MPNEMSTTLWKRSCSPLSIARWLTSSPPKPTLTTMTTDAPIAKLPVELLGEIFLASMPAYQTWADIPMSEELAPLALDALTLSHVCANWRAVALSLPMLWCTLWIDRPRAAHLHMVKLCLERTNTHSFPLSIHLRQTDPKICLAYPTPDEHATTESVLALLVPHFRRWQTVELLFKSTAQPALADLSLEPVSVEETILESVTLDVDSWDTCAADALQSTLFSRPSVRRITFLSPTQPTSISWSSLTELIAPAPECTHDAALSILAACSALQRAHLTISDQPDWAPPFVHPEEIPVVLPAMRSLSLTGRRVGLARLLGRLVLPAVESLALEYAYVVRGPLKAVEDDKEDEEVAALRSLLVRSACTQTLTAFTLREATRTHTVTSEARSLSLALLSLLATHAPKLDALTLHVPLTDAHVEILALGIGADSPEGPVQPFNNLVSLSLVDTTPTTSTNSGGSEHLTDGLLAALVLSRTGTAAALRFVEIKARVRSHEEWVIPEDGPGMEVGMGAEVRFERMGCVCEC